MSNKVDNFLAHYGVKGMKWGVRKGVEVVGQASLSNPTLGTNSVAVRVMSTKAKPATPDEAKQAGDATMSTLHHMLTTKRKEVRAVMDKVDSKYDPFELGTNPDKVRAYDHEMSLALSKLAQKVAPSGAKAFVRVDGENVDLYVGSRDWFERLYKGEVYHSDEWGIKTSLKVLRDKNKFITGFAPLNSNLKHSDFRNGALMMKHSDRKMSEVEREVKNGSSR